MTTSFNKFQTTVASAFAAIMFATLFVGASVAPAISPALI